MAKKKKVHRNKSKDRGRRNYITIGSIVVAAVVLVIALILFTQPYKVSDGYSGPDDSVERGVTEAGLPYLGSSVAPGTLLEYEDFGCTNCQRFVSEVEPFLLEEYIKNGTVRLVIYTMAFVSQTQSVPGAEAAACAGDQGKFWEYRHLLFANLGAIAFTRGNIIRLAERVEGLDVAQFSSCYDSRQFRREVMERTEAGRQSGVGGTPTIEVGGIRYPGLHPFDSVDINVPGIKQLIELYIKQD